jgi:hypothetical protein
MTRPWFPAPLVLVTLALSAPLAAQQTAFPNVKARFNRSAKDLRLVDKDADLIFDDANGKLIVRCPDRPLDIRYDDVTTVSFETTQHMRGGALGQAVGGVVGAAIQAKRVTDYWFYLEYKQPDGSTVPYLLEVHKDSADDVIEKARAVFGDRVTLPEFPAPEDLDKNTLKDLQSKHDLKVDKKSHPLPGLRPDKALVVVVCPPLAARFAGKGNQFKLHAGDQVIAVNKMGTYSFAYLDPGEYLMATQSENASGMTVTLEAGKAYYFLQNTFMGWWKGQTRLSQHSRELVMYELSGACFSNWSRKK